MSLKVVAFPGNNLNDIPGMLRKFADDIEAGEYGKALTVLAAMETEEGFHSFGWGAADCAVRNAGLFEIAKQTQIESAME